MLYNQENVNKSGTDSTDGAKKNLAVVSDAVYPRHLGPQMVVGATDQTGVELGPRLSLCSFRTLRIFIQLH